MKRHPVCLAAAFLLTHCARELPPIPQDPALVPPLNPATDYTPVSGEAAHTDIARFLAGRPVRHGQTLSAIQRTSTPYQAHALDLDYVWRKFTLKRRTRQQQYFHSDLRPLLGTPSTIVYPFGGPDLLYVSSMFPTASTYVLLGLEKTGSVPELSNPQPLLASLARVMDEPMRHGYFITEEMRQAPPVTPILLTTLGLMKADIHNVQAISAAGRPGVRIDYRSEAGGNKHVIYVEADISNSGFNSSLQSWLNQYSGATTYFKAASYLMHDGAFSGIKNWVLSNSRAVLQDDSGIPYRDFNPAQWNVTLLGTYQRPIPLFAKWQQNDLAAAYQALGGRGPEIPFGSGYHMKIANANYQVATRR